MSKKNYNIINKSSTLAFDSFDLDLNSLCSRKDIKKNNNNNLSFSNFDDLSYNDFKFDSQEDFIIFRDNLDLIYFGSKKEKTPETIKDNGVIDKNMKEDIQLKVREIIYSKKPFKEKKKLGRKKKLEEGLGEHNKFSDDNILRKIRSAILNSVLIFINKTIQTIYSNLDKNSLKDIQLFKLSKKTFEKGKAEYNKQLLNKTLKSILSEDISSKYSRYSQKHNKNIIDNLINEKDEIKREYFNKIFSLTFKDCLNHFRGSLIIKELNGLKNFEQYFIDSKLGNDKEMYKKVLKYFLFNYEKEILNKKERNRIKK